MHFFVFVIVLLDSWKPSRVKKIFAQGTLAVCSVVVVILGMALLKTILHLVQVIRASYPLLKKINTLVCDAVMWFCCALILEGYVI